MELTIDKFLKICKPVGYNGEVFSFTVFSTPKEAMEETKCKMQNVWSFLELPQGGYCLTNELVTINNLGFVVTKKTILKDTVWVSFDKWG